MIKKYSLIIFITGNKTVSKHILSNSYSSSFATNFPNLFKQSKTGWIVFVWNT